jgi:hypothetical protein
MAFMRGFLIMALALAFSGCSNEVEREYGIPYGYYEPIKKFNPYDDYSAELRRDNTYKFCFEKKCAEGIVFIKGGQGTTLKDFFTTDVGRAFLERLNRAARGYAAKGSYFSDRRKETPDFNFEFNNECATGFLTPVFDCILYGSVGDDIVVSFYRTKRY